MYVTVGVGCASSSGRLLSELGGLVSTECVGCGTGHLRLPLVSLHQQGLSTTFVLCVCCTSKVCLPLCAPCVRCTAVLHPLAICCDSVFRLQAHLPLSQYVSDMKDRQTDRRTDGQTERRMDRCTDRKTDGWKKRQVHGCMDEECGPGVGDQAM